MSFADPVTAIFSSFTSDDALSAIIGKRCFPRLSTPQTPKKPYVTYLRVSGVRDVELGGVLADHAGARFQVDVIADDFASANAICSAIRAILSRGGPSVGGIASRWGSGVRRITLSGGPRDQPQYEPGLGQASPYLILDLFVTYKET